MAASSKAWIAARRVSRKQRIARPAATPDASVGRAAAANDSDPETSKH
jgi:hypothetical protein